jgi:hypothetical protein
VSEERHLDLDAIASIKSVEECKIELAKVMADIESINNQISDYREGLDLRRGIPWLRAARNVLAHKRVACAALKARLTELHRAQVAPDPAKKDKMARIQSAFEQERAKRIAAVAVVKEFAPEQLQRLYDDFAKVEMEHRS